MAEDVAGPTILHAVEGSGRRCKRAVTGLRRAIDSGEAERMLVGCFS
jgi:hypothetical protein